MATQVASLYGVLDLNKQGWDRGINEAKREARGLGTQLQNLGGSMMQFGTSLSMAMAPVGLALGQAVNASRTFSRSMSNVQSILGLTGDEAAGLRDSLLTIGGDSIFGPQAAVESYYDVVSAGITDTATSFAVLNAAIATAEAGQADLKATTSALISVMNSYGFGADEASRVSDVMTRSVQMGVLTMDQLAAALPQVTGLAGTLGIDILDLAAQMSYLTTQGFSASEAATALSNMMTFLLNPTQEVKDIIAALGYESGAAMIETLGLAGAYAAIGEAAGGLDGTITNVEALRGALGLTKDGATEFFDTFVEGADGATEAARAIQEETAGWQKFAASVQELTIRIGDELAPILLELLNDRIIPLVDGVVSWIKENPKLAETIALITGALVVAGPIIAAVGTGVKALLVAVAFLSPVAVGLAAAIAGIVYAMSELWPGGLPGLLDDARNSFMMLTFLGVVALDRALQWLKARLEDINRLIQNMVNLINDLSQEMQNIGRSAVVDMIEFAASDNKLEKGLSNIGAFGRQVGGALSNVFSGRADGGPVTGGTPYIVGERGPELFVPSSNGAIIPNGGGAGMTNTFNIYQQPGENSDQLARRIVERMRASG